MQDNTEKKIDRKELFCQEFLVDFNATQAAIRAGYSEKTARSIGSENLSKPDILNRINEIFSERAKKLELDQEWVLKNLKETHDEAAIDRNHNARLRSIELVGKWLGMFKEQYEHTHKIPPNFWSNAPEDMILRLIAGESPTKILLEYNAIHSN